MLLVVFAIREYGKKYNRLRWPLLGRVSTSKVAGTLVFLAVLGLWLSPWAPIQPIQSEPDLWRLLEQGLDDPVLMLADRDKAMIAPPIPSEAAQRSGAAIAAESPPFPLALKAVAESRFDEADALLDKLERDAASDAELLELVRAARAQADVYAGHYAEASRRYRELLAGQPRREDYLAHAALAAALAGDYAAADARARQLLDQAGARRHDAARYRQALNLLVAINVMQGRYEEAQRLGEEAKPSTIGRPRDGGRGSIDSPLVADANNQAVLAVLTTPANGAENLSAGFVSAIKLAEDWNAADGQPRDSADLCLAAAEHNLGMAELVEEHFDRAKQSLTEALATERRLGEGASQRMVDLTTKALGRAEVGRRK